MKDRIYSICEKIIVPITNNLAFFILQFIIIYTPTLLSSFFTDENHPYLYEIKAIPIITYASYVLCVIVSLLHKYKYFTKTILYFCTSLLTFIESFIILKFGTRLSIVIYQLIAETNPDEINGFFNTYVFNGNISIYIILSCIILVAILIHYAEKYNYKVKLNHGFTFGLAFFLIFIVSINVFRDIRYAMLFRLDFQEFDNRRINLTYGNNYTTSCLLITSKYLYDFSKNNNDTLKEVLDKDYEINCKFKSPKIVFILGESFNKHHSSLYGYYFNTNPKLSIEKENGNLYVFNDVVAPFRATIENLQYIFSFGSQDKDILWCKTPLFPAIFKKAGYNTYFISNQESKENTTDLWEVANNYLVSKKTAPLLFTKQNCEKFQYDGELLQEYIRLSQNDDKEKELVIFHLMGQHAGYKDRYPKHIKEFNFSAKDYDFRTDLNYNEKEYLAQYDNATLYNDLVVSQIINYFKEDDAIIIYISDHGEEVFDYRNFAGRSLEAKISKEKAKYVYQVPFIIWMSRKYQDKHQYIVEKIKQSIDNPYMTDDLPHLMLDLAGIECEWFDSSRSIINENFNSNRKRLLEPSKQDYDEIMNNI